MSDTPRTDAEGFHPDDAFSEVVDADFARQLERELTAAKVEIERLRADAERYRHLCEYQRWAPEIEAAFDCSPKVLIDEAIDNSIKAMKEPK